MMNVHNLIYTCSSFRVHIPNLYLSDLFITLLCKWWYSFTAKSWSNL